MSTTVNAGIKAKMDDGKERMERRIRGNADFNEPAEAAGQERKRINLAGKVIRQLPLPPRDAALERPSSGRGELILTRPLLPIENPAEFVAYDYLMAPTMLAEWQATPPPSSNGISPRLSPSPRSRALAGASAAAPTASDQAAADEQRRLLHDQPRSQQQPPPPPPPVPPPPLPPVSVHDLLPLDAFNPEEGPGDAAVGQRAYSQYTGLDGVSRWEPCNVQWYDESQNLYEIRWAQRSGSKRVSRFNLRLEGEQPGGRHAARWENNLKEATEMAYQAELELATSIRLGGNLAAQRLQQQQQQEELAAQDHPTVSAFRSSSGGDGSGGRLHRPSLPPPGQRAGAQRFVLSRERLLAATARIRNQDESSDEQLASVARQTFELSFQEASELFDQVQSELKAQAKRARADEPSQRLVVGSSAFAPSPAPRQPLRLPAQQQLQPARPADRMGALRIEVDTQELLVWLRQDRLDELRALQDEHLVQHAMRTYSGPRLPLHADRALLLAMQKLHVMCEERAATPLVARLLRSATMQRTRAARSRR